MKKIMAGLLMAASLLTFGCGGRNADFGTVDMQRVEAEAPVVKAIQADIDAKGASLKLELDQELAKVKGDSEAESKLIEDYSARMRLAQSEAQNKFKSSLDTALHQVAAEKKLGAILLKDAVPQGGTDVTKEVIEKMQ